MHNQNPTLPDTQPVDNDMVNFGNNESRVQGYDPPPHRSQFKSGWYNPNQNGYYQPMQTYPSPDPVVQRAFDQECYAARLANHYQSVAEHNAKAAEERIAHAEQETEWLRQTIQQQSMVPNQSQFSTPAQASALNADEALARQLAAQEATSAEQPVLSQSAMTIPTADLPVGTYSIYCPKPDPATVTQYVDPQVQKMDIMSRTQLCTDLPQSMLQVKVLDAKLLHKMNIKQFDSTSKAWSKWRRNFEIDMNSVGVPEDAWVAIVARYLDDATYKAYEHWTM